MKNLFRVIAFCCIVLFVFSCKKGHLDIPLIQMDSDSMVHRFFNYKPGSYWIYRDALSGRKDSFFVRSNYYIKTGETHAVFNNHFISVVGINIDGSNIDDSCLWIYSLQGNKIVADYHYGRNDYGWENYISYTPLFKYPFVLGDNNSSFDTATVDRIDSFVVLNGLPFHNVAQMHQLLRIEPSTVQGLTYIDDVFSICDSVGIVKMNINHPEHNVRHNWELIRYNVMKQ